MYVTNFRVLLNQGADLGWCEAKSLKTSHSALHCFEGHWFTNWPLVWSCPNEFEILGPCNYFLWSPKQEEWQPFDLRREAPLQMLLQLLNGWKKPLFHITCLLGASGQPTEHPSSANNQYA